MPDENYVRSTQIFNLYRALDEDINKKMMVMQQEQLRDVLMKRLETYPKVWSSIQKYWQHWCYDNKKLDIDWANNFLKELYECNELCGVFFSEPVYRRFHEFRSEVRLIRQELQSGKKLENYHRQLLDKIWFGDSIDSPGLATELKNDLGSYQLSAIQSIHWKNKPDSEPKNNTTEDDKS